MPVSRKTREAPTPPNKVALSTAPNHSVSIDGSRQLTFDDFIKVLPTPGKRDGFIGRVRAVWYDKDTREVTGIDVWGGKGGHASMRTLPLDRIEILGTRKQNSLRLDEQRRRNGE